MSLRVAVMGPGGCGKSNLVMRYMHDRFEEGYDPTIEDVHNKAVVMNGAARKLEILDTAGQSEYRSQWETYLKLYDNFLFCFSLGEANSFEELREEFYERLLRSKEGDPYLLIVVGCKSDMERKITEEEVREVVENEWGAQYIETSAKTDVNVQETFDLLIRELSANVVAPEDKGHKCRFL